MRRWGYPQRASGFRAVVTKTGQEGSLYMCLAPAAPLPCG